MAEQEVDGARELRVALDDDLAHGRFVASQDARQRRGRDAYDEIRRQRTVAAGDEPVVPDRQPQLRQRGEAELHSPSGERREPLARPLFRGKLVFDRSGGGRVDLRVGGSG